MAVISNTEKQARFRKKEKLKFYADMVYREWEAKTWNQTERDPSVRAILDKAVDLPFAWTDEDYEAAEESITQIKLGLWLNDHQLENDVIEGRDNKEVNDKEIKPAIEKTKLLSSLLISAIQLSECTPSDQAAALMEVIRFVGRELIRNRKIPKTNATALCLAGLGPQYKRPEWFIGKLTNVLCWNLNKERTDALGHSLLDFDYKDNDMEEGKNES